MAEFTVTKNFTVDCPSCKDSRVQKAGRRNNYQRFQCQACKKWFRINGQANGRKYDAELIGATVNDYYSGLSIKQLAEGIEDRYDVPEPSKAVIYDWITDYTDDAKYALKDVKAKTSGHWVADEMYVRVGGITLCCWNIMDKQTRFMLASYLTATNGEKEATEALQKALAVADRPPDKVTSDQWKSYPPAISKLFPNAQHIQSQGIEHPINNNRIERLNGTYRARDKTLRGMHSITSAQHLLDGLTIDYNFFRDHEALNGRTPAEAAKVESPFKEWADVVRADIDVPEEWKKRVVRRGTARIPRKQAERAKEIADKKQAKRYGTTEGRAKGKNKGRVRGPKEVLPDVADGHVDRQLPFPKERPATKTTSDDRPADMEITPRRGEGPATCDTYFADETPAPAPSPSFATGDVYQAVATNSQADAT